MLEKDSRRFAIINASLTIVLIALTIALIALTIALARYARRLDVLTHSLVDSQRSSPPPEQSPTPTPTVAPILSAIPVVTPTPNLTPSPSPQPARARHRYPSHPVRAIRIYDAAGNVIETHEHKGEFKEW